MDNFYHDNPDIAFHLSHMDLDRIIELRERGFSQRGTYAYAPKDLEDAKDSYARVLDVVGHIAGDFIAPRAAEVDEQEAVFENGDVRYARGTQEALDMLTKADLMGFTLPRQYGGLNFPVTVYSMAIEMVSRADAALMNLFGLQDIAETINKFATEDIKQRYLPRFARGEVTGAMALTEPEAGSDLQRVSCRAIQKEDGSWVLNGMKRFITNGCGEVSLVLARSEENRKTGRGLSLFLYEREEHMQVRRIEHKMGIHGSPTCELQFNDAPCELIGKRKRGLTHYTMALMNGARVAIAAQAVGLAEAAYREAYTYANERVQFGKPIRDMIPVYDMLCTMKVSVEAGRTLLYEATRVVDFKDVLEERAGEDPDAAKQHRDELKRMTKYANLLTPLAKAYTTEMVNRVAYDAIQVHGGTGFMRDFPIERMYRDARITNIYEGTTQLQVVAAIGAVMTGVAAEYLDAFDEHDYAYRHDLYQKLRKAKTYLYEAIEFVRSRDDTDIQKYHARRLVDMCTDVLIGYLFLRDAAHAERKKDVAETFIEAMVPRVYGMREMVCNGEDSMLKNHVNILDE